IKKKKYDLILADIKMPEMDGIELLELGKKFDPELQFIVMTAYASVDTAVKAIKEGAFDYIVKPVDPENVSQVIKRSLKYKMLEKENLILKSELEKKHGIDEIIGKSKKMEEIFDLIRIVADSESIVMIRGESGTGKELIAKAIHAHSKRKYGPFIALNCGSLPDTLLESELFGYEKGAFTGAQSRRKGRIEMAHTGTLFLDEIGDISQKTQVDLLRVIQERLIYRLGSTEPIEIDARIISATNRDLEAAIKSGGFREDLYYRLNVITIDVPPLRERRDDIPLLVKYYLNKNIMENRKQIINVSSKAMEKLVNYSWPGNVRELENVIERAVVISKTPELNYDDLPESIKNSSIVIDHEEEKGTLSLSDKEKSHILEILETNDWNISRTSRELKIDRTTLYNKMKKHQIKHRNE
ncbi:MAG: sigma-54-dependent Fis family transcriptional regulator, partial [Candidatus Aminicenantes bacterium]|nr:sigma-54-dependent Fis family transcriptional regulator [Candidatus Aminicenantes bacterium]